MSSDDHKQDAEVAKLGVKVDKLEKLAEQTEKKIDELLAFMNQSKGGWKVIILVAGVAGTAGAVMAKLLPFIGGLPK